MRCLRPPILTLAFSLTECRDAPQSCAGPPRRLIQWKAQRRPPREPSMLQSLLAGGRPLLADGATGTNLRLMLHKLEARTRELNPPRRPERTRSRRQRRATRRCRWVNRADGRPPCSAGTLERRRGGRRLHRADRGPTRRRRGRWRAAAVAAGKCGRPYTVTASFDTASRTMMGVAPARVRRSCPSFRPSACRVRCELRRRRLRPLGGDPWDEARRDTNRQGQRRRTAMAWGGNPLFRNAGAHGDLRGSRG